MLIQAFPAIDKPWPEIHFGQSEGKLFIELDPRTHPGSRGRRGGAAVYYRKKKLPFAEGRDIITDLPSRRFQLTAPGIYSTHLGWSGETLTVEVLARPGMPAIYDLIFKATSHRFRVNGIKLSSLRKQEVEPVADAPTLWERLDA